MVIRAPSGGSMMVDCGGRSLPDDGGRRLAAEVVRPWLSRRRLRDFDFVAVTH